MPIHDFSYQPKQSIAAGGQPQITPAINYHPQNLPDLNRVDNKSYDNSHTTTEDIKSILPKGFDLMDRGIKEYFTGIRIPTINGTKEVTVRIAGGDRSILFWKQDLLTGRIQIPVMSINRGGWRFNPNKFSTPYLPAYRRMADRDGTRMVLTPREWPCLIDYTLSAWTERKEDIEYLQYQISTRFNPLAEWKVEDEHMTGLMIAKLESISDVSDKESAPETLPKIKYDFSMSVEGWLPLPSRIVPTVLGQPQVLQDFSGEVYGSINPNTL